MGKRDSIDFIEDSSDKFSGKLLWFEAGSLTFALRKASGHGPSGVEFSRHRGTDTNRKAANQYHWLAVLDGNAVA